MNDALRSLLLHSNGVVTWADARRVVPPWVIDNARRSGALRRLLPEVYVDASRADDPEVLRRAALAYASGQGALSHTTALAVWGLHERPLLPELERGGAVIRAANDRMTTPARIAEPRHPATRRA